MRIGAVVRPESVNANYRARIPLVALGERGHEIGLYSAHDLPRVDHFDRCDVVHFCRVWEEPFQHLAQALRDAGIGVTWDSDDDLTAIEKETAGYQLTGGYRAHQVARDMRRMLSLAHVVTTPSLVLAERFEQYADEVQTIENYLAPPMVLPVLPRRINANIRVGWIAANEHRSDVEALRIRALVERMLLIRPTVEFISVGVGLGIDSPRYHRIPSADLLELPNVAAQLDIAIAPLADTPFNRARSNIKLKEYAGGGAAWLASNLAPYHGLGEHEGGLLVADDEWEKAITQLLGDSKRREALAARSRAWGRRQTIIAHLDEWEQVFGVAIDRAVSTRR